MPAPVDSNVRCELSLNFVLTVRNTDGINVRCQRRNCKSYARHTCRLMMMELITSVPQDPPYGEEDTYNPMQVKPLPTCHISPLLLCVSKHNGLIIP